MELTCALVLLIVGSVTAGPYGYGTKGGAAAKADARAVAGAYAGAGSVPLSIPSGASYTGSFSQSSSSSASSSSASSSSFSYSGSGAVGGVVPGGNGCGSGNCNAGSATGFQGSAAGGAQAYSGANAGSLAGGYGSKIPTSSYGHTYGNGESNKGQDCRTGNCQGTSDLSGSGAGIGSQSSSDAKAAASAGIGQTEGSDCGGSGCNNIPGADKKCVSGDCDSKVKCSSGDCGATSDTVGTPSRSDDSNKCTSGQCGLNQDTVGIDSDTNDINVHGSGSVNSKSSYGANKPGCSSGNCGSSPTPGHSKTSDYNKPALDLIAPKLEPSCSGYNCQISPNVNSSSSQTKAPYTSTSYQNENQLGLVSSTGYGGGLKPTYAHGSSSSYSPVKPSGGASCAPGTPGCATLSGPSAPGSDGSSNGKPNYSHGSPPSFSSLNPLAPGCTPGSPGCTTPTSPSGPLGCASGNCGGSPTLIGYTGFSNKPSYSQGSLPSFSYINPSSPACTPGSPGCTTPTSPSGLSGCVSGNCGGSPTSTGYGSFSNKPSYSHGSSPSYSSLNPSSPACIPGSPGCTTPTSPSGPSGCASGNCGGSPSSTGYGGFSNKPSYSHGSSPSFSSLNPSAPACTPGSPGCTTPTSPSAPSGCTSGNCGGSSASTGYNDFGNKLSYSHGNSPSYFPSKISGPGCAPGSPGCGLTSSLTGSSDCASGNCNVNPGPLGYVSSSNTKPSYPHGSSPSYNPVKPVGLPCAPGTPGCNTAPSTGSSGCIPGINCEAYPSAPNSGSSSIKPNYSQDGSYSALSPAAVSPSSCTSGNCGSHPTSVGSGSFGIKPSYAYGSLSATSQVKPTGPACAPGTPGCALPLAPSGPSLCASGNCDEFPPIGGQGGFPSTKPSYFQGSSSYFPVKPSEQGCAPGTPGCATTPSLSSQSGCTSGKCGGYPSLQGCAPGSSGCSGLSSSGVSGIPSGHANAGTSGPASGVPSYGSSSLPSGPTNTVISAPGYGVSGVGSSLNQAAHGVHGTGSLQTSFINPSTGVSTGSSGSGAYTPGFPSISSVPNSAPGIGSSPQLGIVGAGPGAGASGQLDAKENLPAYTGGFGGPGGILKPNEYSAAPGVSYGNKPTVSTGPTADKPGCVSGICDGHASPSLGHGGTEAGAIATAGASASADAVAYTGGFGGPPGFLKPYDNGKGDIKGAAGLGSSLHLQQGVSGNDYLSGESHVGGSAIAKANAGAVSSVGASSGDNKLHSSNNGGYSHGHDAVGGCGGGCGGSGSGSLGFSGSLGLSKTGILDDSSNGLASAGAVAKSVANASSGARAFGGSYASSSATAHAGAAVKGGYGRR